MWDAVQKKAVLSQSEAQQLLMKCMEVLYYRDARAFEKVKLLSFGLPLNICPLFYSK